MKDSHPGLHSTPCWVGAHAERVLAARAKPIRLKRMFDRSSVPMLLVDSERRYVHANAPARLAFRQSLAELRRLRIDDLTPGYFHGNMHAAWERLTETGCVRGTYDVASPAGTSMQVVYCAMADALPGLYLIAFAPASWPDGELVGEIALSAALAKPALTRRELEILELAAEGCSAPMIAEELLVGTATVRTHFRNIYEKLEVHDRAGAVAKALRLGLIQ